MKDNLMQSYINLASAILLRALQDVYLYEREEASYFVSESDYKCAKEFLESEDAKYLQEIVSDWNRLNNKDDIKTFPSFK